MHERKIVEGKVIERFSRMKYLIELDDGDSIPISLTPKQVMNYVELEINSKVNVELIPPKNKEGLLLTESNMKMYLPSDLKVLPNNKNNGDAPL